MSMITEQVERLRTLADIAKDIADNSTDTVKTLREAADTIEQLAAKARPKTGHWIRVDKDKLRCSKCDVIHFIGQYPQGKIAWCPNCGAKIVESEDN